MTWSIGLTVLVDVYDVLLGDSCRGYLQFPVVWGREGRVYLSFSGRELLWARSKPYFLLDQKVEKNQGWTFKAWKLRPQIPNKRTHFVQPAFILWNFHACFLPLKSKAGWDDLKDWLEVLSWFKAYDVEFVMWRLWMRYDEVAGVFMRSEQHQVLLWNLTKWFVNTNVRWNQRE